MVETLDSLLGFSLILLLKDKNWGHVCFIFKWVKVRWDSECYLVLQKMFFFLFIIVGQLNIYSVWQYVFYFMC